MNISGLGDRLRMGWKVVASRPRMTRTAKCVSPANSCFGAAAAFFVLLAGFGVSAPAASQSKEASDAREPAPRASHIDPKAQELIDQAIRALGGDSFLNAKSIRTEGRIFSIRDDSTAGLAKYESIVEYPGKRRFSYGKGKPVTLINDGERGWQLDRYGMVRQSPERVRLWNLKSRYAYESLLRNVIHEQGLLIQYSGTEFVGPVSTHVISVVDSAQVQIKLYLDANTLLPVKETYRLFNSQSSEWEEYGEEYADFKEIQGIRTPMQITGFRDGERAGETFRKSVRYNVEIPANYFTPGG